MSGASELRQFSHFYISKTAISFNILLVLMILCRYKWHACRLTCTDRFPNVPTTPRKSIMGGGGAIAPCPPGYANALSFSPSRSHSISFSYSHDHRGFLFHSQFHTTSDNSPSFSFFKVLFSKSLQAAINPVNTQPRSIDYCCPFFCIFVQ